MKKFFLILITVVVASYFVACNKNGKQQPNNSSKPKVESSSEKQLPALTDDEEKMVGLWESDKGDILAIKARAGRIKDNDEDFTFDAIFYSAVSDLWIKITREDGSFFEKKGENFVLGDNHLCPTDNEQTNLQMTCYQLTYNEENKTIEFNYLIDEQPLEAMKTIYRKTNKDVETADWDWYYKIHPERK